MAFIVFTFFDLSSPLSDFSTYRLPLSAVPPPVSLVSVVLDTRPFVASAVGGIWHNGRLYVATQTTGFLESDTNCEL